MTDRQFRSLLRYIRKVADGMGLRDWDIRLRSDPTEDPAHVGTVECVYGRKRAAIQIAADWLHHDPEEQRHVVVHELVHIHLDGELTLIENALPGHMGAAGYGVFQQAFRQTHEHAVDAIASALEPLFPLWVP